MYNTSSAVELKIEPVGNNGKVPITQNKLLLTKPAVSHIFWFVLQKNAPGSQIIITYKYETENVYTNKHILLQAKQCEGSKL